MVFSLKLQHGSLRLLIILFWKKRCFFVRNNLSSAHLQSEDEASYMASDGDDEYDDEFDDDEEDSEFDDDEDEDINIDLEADEDSLQSNSEKINSRRRF